MSERVRCELVAGRLTACDPLEAALESPYGRGVRSRGLIRHHMVSMETRKFTRHLVAVKSGEHGKKSIIANFCPFCGSSIFTEDQPE